MKNDFWNELGDLYLKANAVDSAIDSYNKAIQQGYKTGEIYSNLASAYMRQGHIIESIQLYQKSIELLESNHEKAVVFTKIGDCFRRLQDFDNAIMAFRSAIDLEPGNPRLTEGLSDVQRDMEALYSLEDSAEQPAGLLISMLEGSEGITTTSIYASRADNNIQISLGAEGAPQLGTVFVEQLQNECAEIMPPVFEDVDFSVNPELPDEKNNSDLLNKIPPFISDETTLVQELNEIENLVFSSGSGLITEENSVPALETADGTSEVAEVTSEIAIQDTAIQEDEEGVRVTMFLTLGIIYWRNGNLEEADRILQSAVDGARNIKNTWIEALAWHALALVKSAQADIIGAIQAFLQAAELAPEQIFPWSNLGTLYNNIGKSDEALVSFIKAVKRNPEDSASWDGLGDIYTNLGRLDDAIAAYQLGNVFDAGAFGADAIKTYEKAFDFYHFTVTPQSAETSETMNETTSCVEENEFVEGPQKAEDTHNLGSDSGLDVEINPILEEKASPIIENSPELAAVQISEPEFDADDLQDISTLKAETLAITAVDQPESICPSGETVQLDSISNINEPGSKQVVALYEQFMDEISNGEEEDNDQFLMERENFVEDLVGLEPEQFEQEIKLDGFDQIPPAPDVHLVGDHVDNKVVHPQVVFDQSFFNDNPSNESSIAERGIEVVIENNNTDKMPLVDEAFEQQVTSLGSGLKSVEDTGGMLPIVPVEPSPRSEVNKVAGTIATYEATVRENPYNDRAWDSLGNLYRIVQRNKDAIRSFERAVELEPAKYVYHYQLGTLYASEGKFPEAIREIQTVVELNPDFTFAHCALASYLRRVGQDDEAEKHIAFAAPFMKNEKEYDRACFESIRGNVDGALELLEIALEKKQTTIEWIQRDLDLDFIRQDSRYRLLATRSSQSVVGY